VGSPDVLWRHSVSAALVRGEQALADRDVEVALNRARVVANLKPLVLRACERGVGVRIGHCA
jgi:hypothetical protein